MPFLFAVLYYVFIVPAYAIGGLFEDVFGEKVGSAVWWIVIHAMLYTIFIALPLWFVFDISVLTNVIIFAVLEVICFAVNAKNKLN